MSKCYIANTSKTALWNLVRSRLSPIDSTVFAISKASVLFKHRVYTKRIRPPLLNTTLLELKIN